MSNPIRPLAQAAAALLVTAACAHAGPLNPPAGPIAPTHKTLTEIEPRTPLNATTAPGDADSLFRIAVPGSYYLTGNITGASAKHGIEIAVGNVTLDLNGFTLAGVPGSLSGIVAGVAGLQNIEIRSGVVSDWTPTGIDLSTNAALGSRITDIRVARNNGVGLRCGSGAVVTACVAVANIASGISASVGCTLSHCSAISNDFIGMIANTGCSFDHCVASGNGDSGISAGSAAVVSNCSAVDNGTDGITANGAVIIGNVARNNDSDGISVAHQCVVINNMCYDNDQGAGGGAGIRVSGGDNRLEGNNCSAQAVGIDVGTAGNIIIRNTCAGNTNNWDIVANNYYGPIVNRSGAATPAASGNGAASTLNTTDPNANFSY